MSKIAYLLREVPLDVWDALTQASERERLPRRTVVLKALRQYLDVPITETDRREIPHPTSSNDMPLDDDAWNR